MSAEVKLSLPLDTCPVCSIPLDVLWVFQAACDSQMHALTGCGRDQCCGNIKVEAAVICFWLFTPAARSGQQLAPLTDLENRNKMQIFILICLLWPFSLFVVSFIRLGCILSPWLHSLGLFHATVITRGAWKLFPIWHQEGLRFPLLPPPRNLCFHLCLFVS